MTLFPVFLDMRGARVLVVGAGPVALRRTRGLVEVGALVTVVAPSALPEFEQLGVTLVRRAFRSGDLEGALFVFACTNDEELNDEVVRQARERGVWCASASRPEAGTVRLGATIEKGGVRVAISTGAELPYLSQALRDRVAAVLPDELPLSEWTARRRAALALPDGERELALDALRTDIRAAVSA